MPCQIHRPEASKRPLALVAAVAGAVLTVAVTAPAEPHGGAVSLGQANDGSLLRGVRLPDRGPGFVSRPARRGVDAKYGTEELVAALTRAAAAVERQASGAILFIGDLSGPGGGPIPGHESHQAGRDADLLFYALDSAGRVTRPRAAHFDGEGRATGPGAGELTFDARRNWLVLRSLIDDPDAHLQRVLVSEPLRALLLAHARDAGEPSWVVERAGDAMCDTWSPHDNHFHVRLFCTAEDYRRGCRDEHPLYPWRRTELAAAGILAPVVMTDPHRRAGRARRWLTSRREVRQFCP